MYPNLHLELQANRYYLLCCICTHLLALAVISLLALDYWLYPPLFFLVTLSYIWHLHRNKARQVHLYCDVSGQLNIMLFEQNKRAYRWTLLWRNRRLIILRLQIPDQLLSTTLWISPHSLKQPEQHRHLRIITGFISSSKKGETIPMQKSYNTIKHLTHKQDTRQ